jgi:hypothetical protein
MLEAMVAGGHEAIALAPREDLALALSEDRPRLPMLADTLELSRPPGAWTGSGTRADPRGNGCCAGGTWAARSTADGRPPTPWPILMTTAAMVLRVFALVIASGASAADWVIYSGLSIGTLVTLFVVPAFHMVLSSERVDQDGTDLENLEEVV